MQWRQEHQESFRCIPRLVHHRHRLCCDSFFTWIFLRSFRHHFRTTDRTEMANVKQNTRRWFHSTRVKFPLVSMSTSWILESMYLIWILVSKWIRSNNQSRATLWVLETCLTVGLLPFMIMLITASLSSNTYSKASWWEELTFEGIKSTLSTTLIVPWHRFRFWIVWGVERTSSLFTNGSPRSFWLWFVFPRTATIRSNKSRAGRPSNLNPASKEMISDSVVLCETEVCFLHIQLIGSNLWLPKTQNFPPDVDFESSRSPAKSESWNSLSLHCVAVLPTWQYCVYSHVWWMYEINRFRRLSQALAHFVIDRASVFADHRISGLPMCQVYAFQNNLRAYLWQFSTDFISSSLKWWSSMHGVDTLQSCWVVLFANSQYRSTHFLAWPSMSQDLAEIPRFSEHGNFSVPPAEILNSNMVL